MKSRLVLACTGVVPAKSVMIRLSLGPSKTSEGTNVSRTPGSATVGSCFQIIKREPKTKGIGIGIGIGDGTGEAPAEERRDNNESVS